MLGVCCWVLFVDVLGMNPAALKAVIEKVSMEEGIEFKVAAVEGDDLMEKVYDVCFVLFGVLCVGWVSRGCSVV